LPHDTLEVFAPRPTDPSTGTAFYARAEHLSLAEREELVFAEIMRGNVPDHLRAFRPIELRDRAGRTAIVRVATDYLAVGEDGDFLRMPLTPITAQRVADALGCSLPTTKLVDAIYAASVKQDAIPISPPGTEMMHIARFRRHHELIEKSRAGALGELVAGHKKDVVVTNRLAELPPKVAIYGFYQRSGHPIQPFALPHEDTYVDYSHGIRLVAGTMEIDGVTWRVADALGEASVASIISYEGVIRTPRYRVRPLQG
jgi:hypothetical protein